MNHRTKCKMQNYKTVRGRIGENFQDLWLHEELSDMTSKHNTKNKKGENLTSLKLKRNLFSAKNSIKRMKMQD